MVETAEPQLRFQPSAIRFRFYRPSRWRVLLQSQVSPVVMIVTNEFAAEPSDVRLVDCDHMVEALAASGTDPSLRSPVLPGTLDARPHRLDGRCPQQIQDFRAEFRVAVQYGVLVRTHIREGLTQLLAHPLGSRMGRYVEVENPAPAEIDEEEAVQQMKRQSRHGEKVHRGDAFTMVTQKRQPFLAGAVRAWFAPRQVARHCAFGNVEAQFQ